MATRVCAALESIEGDEDMFEENFLDAPSALNEYQRDLMSYSRNMQILDCRVVL